MLTNIIEFVLSVVLALFIFGLLIEGTKRTVFFLFGKRK